MIDVHKIRALLDAATDGPWSAHPMPGWHGSKGGGSVRGVRDMRCTLLHTSGLADRTEEESNADLIAAAPVVIAELLDWVEKARPHIDLAAQFIAADPSTTWDEPEDLAMVETLVGDARKLLRKVKVTP